MQSQSKELSFVLEVIKHLFHIQCILPINFNKKLEEFREFYGENFLQVSLPKS